MGVPRGWTVILYGAPGRPARKMELSLLAAFGMLLFFLLLGAAAVGAGWQLGRLGALFGF